MRARHPTNRNRRGHARLVTISQGLRYILFCPRYGERRCGSAPGADLASVQGGWISPSPWPDDLRHATG